MSRETFSMDAIFGMEGVSGPGSLIIIAKGLPDEQFLNSQIEFLYQIWLRGYKAAKLDVRDELRAATEADTKYEVDTVEVKQLMIQWQAAGFIPKRPGD